MSRKLDYHSSEYDMLKQEAKRLYWNDDRLSDRELQEKRERYESNIHEEFGFGDKTANSLILWRRL